MKNNPYMKRALTLARLGRTSPNPMVGAVVVQDGQIVGVGYHMKAGEPHAEVDALWSAGELAEGADLYVNLEPCCHHGRTPPCTETIIEFGIQRVFAAMVDPNPQVSGKGIEQLRSADIEVEVGMMEAEARELNAGFIKRVTEGLPFVLWKAAMTIDGKIATKTGNSRWVSGEESRHEVQKIRARTDAIMVDIGTVLADDPQLTVHGIKGAFNPLRVVVDANASTPLDAKVLNSDAPTIIVTKQSAPVDALKAKGVKVLEVQDNGGRIDLHHMMSELAKMGINNVLLEGGGELTASMLADGLVDKGLVFIAPKIIGGRDAKTPVEGKGIELMDDAIKTSSPIIRRFGDDVALEFDLRK